MDISARAISLAVRPQLGHSGHQCSHAPGRPNLHLVSSSRRPRRAGNSIARERLRSSLKLVRLESSTVSKNAPRDARELVGKGDGEHVVMQPLLGGLDPRPEPVAFPSGRFHFYKNDPCRLHEQDAQVAIAPLRYFAEDGAVPVEICLGTSPSHAAKSRPLEKLSPVPIAATMALEMIGPMPGTLIRRSHPASRLASSSISLDKTSMRSSSRCQSEASPSMTRTMRGESTSGGVARMRGSSTRRKRCPCRTAMPRSSRKARI